MSSESNQIKQCEFCGIVSGETPLYQTNPHIDDIYQPPYDSTYCVAWPDAAPLCPGHLLVVPYQHKLSSAKLSNHAKSDLIHTCNKLSSAVLNHMNDDISVYFFEHGSRKEDEKVGCSITHAHIHIVFLPHNILDNTNKLDYFHTFQSIQEAWEHLRGSDYYLIGYLDESEIFGIKIVEESELKCNMFLRKLFADLISKPELSDYLRYDKGHKKDKYVEEIYKYIDLLKNME